VSRLSRKCRILHFAQSYRPPIEIVSFFVLFLLSLVSPLHFPFSFFLYNLFLFSSLSSLFFHLLRLSVSVISSYFLASLISSVLLPVFFLFSYPLSVFPFYIFLLFLFTSFISSFSWLCLYVTVLLEVA
jgi:hypothetical protein